MIGSEGQEFYKYFLSTKYNLQSVPEGIVIFGTFEVKHNFLSQLGS